jgi:hypothetical protein
VAPPTQGFHIVQKESAALLKKTQASGEPSSSKMAGVEAV